jgi:ferredoxin
MQQTIKLHIDNDGISSLLVTHKGEYRNLLALLNDNFFLDGFGSCGGMGRCATCIVKIYGISGNSIKKERNEPITLSRLGYNDPSYRLSCQLLITEDLQNTHIEVFDDG